MTSLKQQARFAGLLYLLLGITAPIGLMYVPGKLIVRGDAAATADRLTHSDGLLRLGIGSELIHQITGIFLVLALYRLFERVNKRHATAMVIFSLCAVPIVFLNVLNEIAAQVIVSGAAFLSAFSKPQLDALAYLFLRLHSQGIIIAAIFWGLWLLPFGLLVIRSGFLPRILGMALFVAGFGYLISSFTTSLLPEFSGAVNQIANILYCGELPIMFWLLVKGAKDTDASDSEPVIT